MLINRLSLIKRRRLLHRAAPVSVGGLALAGLIWFAAVGAAPAADSTNAPAEKVAAPPPAAKAAKAARKAKADPARKLSGVELYAVHCNRCHPERDPVEFNQNQWKTLMLHMRVRANLPAAQARAILQYLQEDAGD